MRSFVRVTATTSTLLVFLICYGRVCPSYAYRYDSYSEMDEDFVDFTDMGSYNHGFQKNNRVDLKNRQEIDELKVKVTRYNYEGPPGIGEDTVEQYDEGSISTKVKSSAQLEAEYKDFKLQSIEISESTTKYKSGEQPSACPTVDESSTMRYIKRIVASLLYQMNVRGHVFGPGEAITIDLQAEISHADFTTLNKFVDAVDGTSLNHLSQVDSILSNLIHVVAPPTAPSAFETLKDGLENLLNVFTKKNVLGLFSLAVVLFMCALLVMKIRSTTNVVYVAAYGFWIFFILSCVWKFFSLCEESKAENYSRLMQSGGVPSDCEFDRMDYLTSVWYYIRVHMFKHNDRCVEYHKEVMVDPFWRVSPIEAISQTGATLIFHPWSYIGTQIGRFLSNASSVFVWWMQPFVLIFLFVFLFLGLFRFKVSTPLFSIEPAGFITINSNENNREDRANNMLPEPDPSLEQIRHQQQVAERSGGEIVQVLTRDASVDTSDFEEYIRLTSRRKSDGDVEPPDDEVPELPTSDSKSWIFLLLDSYFASIKTKYPFKLLIPLFDFCVLILDKILRQVPFIQDSHAISVDCVIP